MEELAMLLVLLLVGGGSSSSSSSKLPDKGPAVSEDKCGIRVDVDGKSLAICRVGSRYRMFVDHTLDPRTFADLAGVLQRAVVVTNPAEARRVTFESTKGTASIVKLDAGNGFAWSFTRAGATEPVASGEEPTMMDALGVLYDRHGKEFLF